MKKPELLAPAGDLEKLKVAFTYGADAVYMGGKLLGMRAAAKNFDAYEMEEGIRYARERGKKVYLTANIFAHNDDFNIMAEYFKSLRELTPDALIISDIGMFEVAREILPNMEIHVSTQANVTNYRTALFWERMGAARIILARELSLREIAEIKSKVGIEIETFVHGSMCMAYSGRCLISNYMSYRDANRGECSQPCRWKYALVEEKSKEILPVYDDDLGSYVFSSKDLCMVEHLPELINAGISSFKIEGRMKTAYYVANVTKVYREAIDDYFADPAIYTSKLHKYRESLARISHREYTKGFYFGRITNHDHAYEDVMQLRTQDFLGIILDYDEKTGLATFEQRNKFSIGDRIEILQPIGDGFKQIVTELYDEKGIVVNSAPHPKQILKIKTDYRVKQYDMLKA